jgi:hypothetical protein
MPLAGMFGMFGRMQVMAMRDMGMVSRLFRRIGAVVLSGMTMVFGGGLVVLGGLLVMLGQFGCIHCDILRLAGDLPATGSHTRLMTVVLMLW